MNARELRQIRREFLKDYEDWKETWPELIALMGLTKPPVVMDMGAAYGASLFSLHDLQLAKRTILVDPQFAYYLPMFQQMKISPEEMKNMGLTTIIDSGYAPHIPWREVEVLIKTYNPFVSWEHLLNRAKKASWIISDNRWLSESVLNRLEEIKTFNLNQQDRPLNGNRNVYVLAKIKK